MKYDVENFQKDVIERSHQIPVLVDFWAEWCGPCKTLGPILERIAATNGDTWALAKVDTEKFPDVAMQYGVRGIPNVKLFVDGDVVNEFTGALPEPAVKSWLEKALPDKFTKELDRAESLPSEGKSEEARSVLDGILRENPENERARVLLAGMILASDPSAATQLVAGIEENSPHFQKVEAIRTFGTMLEKLAHPEQLTDDPVKSAYVAALAALAQFDYDAALEKFIDVIRANRYYDDDGARKACIAIFRVLGDEHAVTQKRRREFSSALY
jgi:putative thioredoxin